ncbi:UDP-N-acetylmuramate dehydrogenase [Sinobaca sp. H24]|uniref:UDP-N-acetylmuramate dehydrogenase n=1 Tax=Sinobaca sp. H24 TaxID=2923376 RepID=UPI00207A1680|nr:UDP-N-acetylmuramate dehydrogenase [Sinobaca sp. H24]
MTTVLQRLKEKQVGYVAEAEPLSKHTTWKIGGPADLFIEPDSVEGLVAALEEIKAQKLPWRAIGRGSNLLVDDKGIEGAVIKLGNRLSGMELDEENRVLTVDAGYSLIKLATIISKKGYSGFEFAGGIPGTIGGAVFMNAGAHGTEIADVLVKARVLYPDGRLEWIAKEDMEFSYRTSRLQKEKGICVQAVFQLKTGTKEDIVAEMQKHKSYRRETQPWNMPCAGSVFRNPLPHHAGQLVESSGLKGYSYGGAQISELHANFIVNTGDAKAADVLAIVEHVKNTVWEKYQVVMNTEVEIVKRHG